MFLVNADKSLSEKVKSRMSADYEDNVDKPEHADRRIYPLTYVSVPKPIPLYITYFTVFPDRNGNISFYPDIYGYDNVLINALKPVSLY